MIVEAALKCTAILLLAELAVGLLRNQSAALRHRIWALALACSLAFPILSFLPSVSTTRPPIGVASAPLGKLPATRNSTAVMVVTASLAAAQRASAAPWLGSVWLAGTALSLTSLAYGLKRLKGLRTSRYERRSGVKIRLASTECMPMTWGFFRPQIILPASAARWGATRKQVVLSHELAHVARHDWAIQMVGEIARAVYWFHPLVWRACSRLRQESEQASDNQVVSSGIPLTVYATELLHLARIHSDSRTARSVALAMAQTSHLERRFTAMLTRNTNRAGLSRTGALLSTLLAIAALVPLAAIHAQTAAGPVTGIISGPGGSPLPNATVALITPSGTTMTASGTDGSFELPSLGSGSVTLRVGRPGSRTVAVPLQLQPGSPSTRNVNLDTGDDPQPVGAPQRIRIGGNVQSTKLLHRQAPAYPRDAKERKSQGQVMMEAVISSDGNVSLLRVKNVEVDPSLARSAVEAVSGWAYNPTLLNGDPVEIQTAIQINYTLAP